MKLRLAVIGLLLFAFTIRVVGISFPAQTVFDEGVSVMMASKIVDHQGIFDIHPPLTHLIDAAFLRPHELPHENLGHFGAEFGGFPYERLRMIRVIVGTLLVGIVFGIAYLLYRRISLAIIPAWIVAIDPALIVHSRLILPDMVLLFLGFAGIFLFLLAQSQQNKKYMYAGFVMSALCFGLALSVKWTALGFLLVPAYSLIREQKIKILLLGIGIMCFVYISVFHIFFTQITAEKFLTLTPEDATLIASMPLPDSQTIFSTIAYLPQYTKNMMLSNSQFQENEAASNPLGWPVGEGAIEMLKTGENKGIKLVANYFSWAMTLVVIVVFVIGFFVWRNIHHHLYKIIGLLIASYFLNYIPYFIIGRTFYLYHYYTALIFGILVLPAGIILFKSYLPHGNPKKYSYVVFVFVSVAMVFSLAVLNRIYGL
jgi:dolichyl-phosphate-mannose--protein O-mannosyl transferase